MADRGEGVTEAIKYRHPLGVKTDDDEPRDRVKICVVLPTLKVKKTITLKKKIANGSVEVSFTDRSFTLEAALCLNGNKEQVEHFRYKINRLPDEIIPSQSHYKIKKGQVVIFIKKKTPGSWSRYLSEGGLETDYDDVVGKETAEDATEQHQQAAGDTAEQVDEKQADEITVDPETGNKKA